MEKICCVDNNYNKTITYPDFEILKSKYISVLKSFNVEKNDFVIIKLKNSIDYVAFIYATLAIGAYYIPLSDNIPEQRLEFIKQDSNAKFLIDYDFIKKYSDISPEKTTIEENAEGGCLIYTSGSTGNSKGVLIPKSSIMTNIKSCIEQFGYNENMKMLFISNMSFITHVFLVLTTIEAKGELHFASDEQKKDVNLLKQYIVKNDITNTFLPPQLYKHIDLRNTSIKTIVTGTDRVSDVEPDASYDLYNAYGSTEVGSVSAFLIDKKYKNTPIGKVMPYKKIYLLDEYNKEVKDGEEGEICIVGATAKEYFNNPELTKKCFIELNGERVFKTNDIAKKDENGNLIYVNRKDRMTKINGQRVEPGEIEIQVKNFDDIQEAVVKDFDNEYGQKYLCCFLKADKKIETNALKKHLQNILPSYMIPTFFVQVDKFQTNANGKLDRLALKPPTIDSFKSEYCAPQTKEEKKIVEAFEACLKIKNVGVNDDFFMLGGDSIKALSLLEYIGESILVKDIYLNKTPKNIASLLNKNLDLVEHSDKILKTYTPTSSEMGIYLECIQDKNSVKYNIPNLLNFKTFVDVQTLKNAIKQVVKKYPNLNSNFKNISGKVLKYRNDNKTFDIQYKKVSILEFEKIKSDFVKPFDLENDNLYKFEIYEVENDVILLFDIHHIVIDGTSLSILINDLKSILCSETLSNEDIDAFDLNLQEEIIKDKKDYKLAKDYFENLFEAEEISTKFPTDIYLESQKNNNNEYRFDIFDNDFLSKFNQFISKNSITENTYFITAFSYAVSKFLNENKVVINVGNNGRNNYKLKNTFGMLVKNLPFMACFYEEECIENVLKNAQSNFYKLVEHSIYPYSEIVKNYSIQSDISFVYQNKMLNGINLGDDFIELEEINTKDTINDITVMVFKKDNGFRINIKYNKDLYSKGYIEAFARFYNQILSEFLYNDKLFQINLLSEIDKKLLEKFNKKDLDIDFDLVFPVEFKKQVNKTPNNIAIVCEDRKYTYKELDILTDNLAQKLLSYKLAENDTVAIMLNRTEAYPIAFIAATKTGRKYMPIDLNYAKERIEFMLKDSGAKILITEKETSTDIQTDAIKIFSDEIFDTQQKKEFVLDKQISPNDTTILLYTSGTTGNPKGAELSFKNLSCFWQSVIKDYGHNEGTNVLAYPSFAFDAHLMDFYPTFMSGATLHIATEDVKMSLVNVHNYVIEHNINKLILTTQLGREYAILYPQKCSLEDLFTGGEALSLCPPTGYRMHNLYGPTESCVFVSKYQISGNEKFYPIGIPFGSNKLYIVDKYNRSLPIGAKGELIASGLQVCKGYLNREELTKEKFIDNKINFKDHYEKFYKTGDICRYLPDGNIAIEGRNDFQVKIRGFRIELSEIENKISQYESVKSVIVTALENENKNKYLVAYLLQNEEIDINKLKDFIKTSLPSYMVPVYFVVLEEFPYTVNGKIDKKKLPLPQKQSHEQAQNRELTYFEEELLKILADVLNSNDFDIYSDFIELGLTSISAMKFTAMIYEKFNCNIKISDILNDCNILKLENILQKELLNKKAEKTEIKSDVLDKVEIISAQKGVYYDTMKNSKSTIYNIPTEIILDKAIDENKLKTCLEKLFEIHKIFNCHIVSDEKNYIKYDKNIKHSISVKLMKEDDYQASKNDFVQPFDLSNTPLYRCKIIKTELNIYILFDVHHIIFDGASFGILLNELKDLYQKGTNIEETSTIFDYAQEENILINSDKFVQAKSFFDDMLANFETCSELTVDKNSNLVGSQKEVIQNTNTKKIQEFCKKNGITPAQFFLSAVSYTLSRYVNNKEIFISTISNGRSNQKYNNTLGMFVKTLPFASKIENGKSVLEYIKQTGKDYRNTIDNDIYTVSEVNKTYDYVPKIIYTCQLGVLEESGVNKNIIVKPLVLETPKMPIAINIENDKENIVINVQYDDSLYLENTIKEFAYSINVVINNFIENYNEKIERVSLIDEVREQKLQQIRKGNIVKIDEKILHKKFEKCVDLAPEKTALIATDGEFTYKELEENSNRIAQYLISKNIQIEDKVVFVLSRTSKIISTIFGVLKSGACYIPCIPDYPKERIDEIVEDSGAKFVICEGDAVSLYKNALDIDKILKFKNTTRPAIDVKPNNLAYMIYTSGTTGKPKGVLIEHKSVSNLITPDIGNFMVKEVVEAGSCLAIATIAFDMGSTEILTSICYGKTLVFADEEQVRDIIKLTELIHKTKPKSFITTPSRIQQFIEWPDFCTELKDVKCVVCGAEGFPPMLYDKLKNITNAKILNGYGPTENTMAANVSIIDSKKVTVGKPITNYIEFVADSDGNELPIGVMGELYIGGVGTARGYQNNKELSDKRFIMFKGERVYKSGDFAKWTENGEVDILGRIDNQVKLRGLRIELDEINGTIQTFENVVNSIVLVKKINGEENLCAYFIASKQIDIDKLKEHLSAILPHYMVPSFMMQIDKFPTNRNGKVNKQELPEFVDVQAKTIVKAENKIEQDFCDIFSLILNNNNISVTDNFFENGGTSLLVTRVILEAKKLNYNINYGDVFNEKTPKNLAKLCENISAKETDLADEIANFDYTKIDNLLEENNVNNFHKDKMYELKDVLLTGATGFLGIHILYDFLKYEKGKIYCLLRKGKFESVEERLTGLLIYYFGENLYSKYSDRIIAIEGDVTDKKVFENLEFLNINAVFNCAANVKHFSFDDEIRKVNYFGILNLIEFCKKKNIRLIQTSTTSISGFSINDSLPVGTKLDEQKLYYNQNLDNKYIYSKFLAEREILKEVSNDGLDAKIMRLGNLSSRNTDGEFQINSGTNSFMGRFKAFNKLTCFPYSAVNDNVEFSPIDCVARAIMLLSATPKKCCVFHPFNNHNIRTGDIIALMQNNGLDIDFVEDDKYIEAIQRVQENEENAELLSSIVAYQDIAHGDKVQVIEAINDYTTQILYRLGYSMPITEENYINKVFDALISLGFFE